jgi:phosphotriesterase-related protein
MAIQTVTGILQKKDAGIMTPHEHIFIELTAFFEERELKDCESPSTAPVTMDKLGILNRDPYALKENLRMNDYETQKKEILRFKEAGGCTIVDATLPGIGRDPAMLKKISESTGINVVMGTGFYVAVNTGTSAYDAYILTIYRATKWQYRNAKILGDGILMVLGICLGGTIGIGTIVSTVAGGYLTQFFIKRSTKLLKRKAILNN